jgi:hypothetical protein
MHQLRPRNIYTVKLVYNGIPRDLTVPCETGFLLSQAVLIKFARIHAPKVIPASYASLYTFFSFLSSLFVVLFYYLPVAFLSTLHIFVDGLALFFPVCDTNAPSEVFFRKTELETNHMNGKQLLMQTVLCEVLFHMSLLTGCHLVRLIGTESVFR